MSRTLQQYVNSHQGKQFLVTYDYFPRGTRQGLVDKIWAWGTLAGIMNDHIPCEKHILAYTGTGAPFPPIEKKEVEGPVINYASVVDKEIGINDLIKAMLKQIGEPKIEEVEGDTVATFCLKLELGMCVKVIIRNKIPENDLPMWNLT
jgi:hypothetical protein